MKVYAYGPAEFTSMIRMMCKGAEALEDLESALKVPQGAVLYAHSLRAAAILKMKAPWARVRTGFLEVTGVDSVQLDVYELIHEIMNMGTCVVHVPDLTLRQALSEFATYHPVEIRFTETCRFTYRCSELATYLRMLNYHWDTFWASHIASFRNARLPDIGAHEKLDLPLETRAFLKAVEPKMTNVCTTVGTPHISVEWDYYLDYPQDLSSEELAAQLREKRLRFLKLMPKTEPFENLCPENVG